ncbi:MAG: ParB/RepB/Spo0J family partition protein [Gammaproteobacteria bacterium]|nr:MAG: ParB/RepB/Spo0J family partition protein [Gammaproteobacteria bacterium]
MAKKKRGLGRGLSALLAETGHSTEPVAETLPAKDDRPGLQYLPVEWLHRGEFQPRREMDEMALSELADSIRSQGIIQPIVARKESERSYEIIAGERRWRAAQRAGLSEVPVVLQECDAESTALMALIENVQREDLAPMEVCNALHRLANEFSMTHQQLAETLGRSRSAITNLMRLIELEDPVKQLLTDGRLEMGHARALLGLKGHEQVALAKKIVTKGLSVREAERLVKKAGIEKRRPVGVPGEMDPDVKQLEQTLSEKLGAQVNVRHQRGGRGQLVIRYNSLDELDGILERLVTKI